MLKPIALFMNGVFESVLEEILQIQSVLPEQIMFLQPYSRACHQLVGFDKVESVDPAKRSSETR
jgi:hypothetical protein